MDSVAQLLSEQEWMLPSPAGVCNYCVWAVGVLLIFIIIFMTVQFSYMLTIIHFKLVLKYLLNVIQPKSYVLKGALKKKKKYLNVASSYLINNIAKIVACFQLLNNKLYSSSKWILKRMNFPYQKDTFEYELY